MEVVVLNDWVARVPRDPEARRLLQEAVVDGALYFSEGCRREDLCGGRAGGLAGIVWQAAQGRLARAVPFSCLPW